VLSIISLFLNINKMSEGYANAGNVNGTAGNAAPVMGGRRRRHSKSAKKVSARKIRATLRKLHMRPKSRMVLKGGVEESESAETQSAGRRRRRRKSRKGLRGMLGF
jgi:hypothetical protein